VRDRATLYLKLLGGEATVGETEKDVNEFLFGSLDVPLVNLETSLRNYVCLSFTSYNYDFALSSCHLMLR
jgi:hypothetical protein